uniref:Uncharacterized protein n=1 Tax=Anguilla anguilla TaxID=7936 RepID=A0A0E9PQY5_ANGAN
MEVCLMSSPIRHACSCRVRHFVPREQCEQGVRYMNGSWVCFPHPDSVLAQSRLLPSAERGDQSQPK